MKMYIRLFLLFCFTGLGAAQGEDPQNSSPWGLETCGAQMSIGSASNTTHFRVGRPLVLSIRVKNNAKDVIKLWDAGPQRDYSVTIISPSGKELPPKSRPPDGSDEEFRRSLIRLKPGEIYESKLDINGASEMNAAGNYTIIVKRQVSQAPGKLCQVKSNSLVVVMEGK